MVCPGPLQDASRSLSDTFWGRVRSCLASVQVSPAWVYGANEVQQFKSSKKCTHPDSNPQPFGRVRICGGENQCAKMTGIAVPATMARPRSWSKSETRKRLDIGQDKSRIRPGPDLDRYLDRPPQSGSIRMTHGRFGQTSVFVPPR